MAALVNVNPTIVNLEVGNTQVLTVNKNGSLTYTLVPVDVAEFDLATYTITALKEGACQLSIKAVDNSDNTESFAICNITVTQQDTTLTVTPDILTVIKDTKTSLTVKTDAPTFTFESSNNNVLTVTQDTVNPNTLLLTAISVGTATITIRATNTNFKEAVKQLNITVQDEQGIPVKVNLYNKNTGRMTTIQTNNNESTEDVVYKLPRVSGTLVTEEHINNKQSTTNNTSIVKPVITSPLNNAVNVETNIVSSAYQTANNFAGAHTHTVWEISIDSKFNNVVKTKTAIAAQGHKLLEMSPCIPLTQVYVRVRYYSNTTSSEWSDTVTFTTGLAGPAGPQKFITGNAITGGYFGEIPYSECIPDTARRDYIGNWETLNVIAANYAHKSKITADNRNIYGFCRGDYLVNAPEGVQVHYKDKLYYAKTLLQCTDGTFTTIPGTNNNLWVEDTRETLDTPKTFLLRIGLGYNARPSLMHTNAQMKNYAYWHRNEYPHTDKPNDLVNYIYPWGMASGKTEKDIPATYDVPQCSWLKFAYKGKILYTPKIPLLASISLTDLAKVHAVHGDRTIRIGSRLYYYRLLKKEEYDTLLVGLVNGTLGNMSSSELDIDINTVDPAKNVYRKSVNVCWIDNSNMGISAETVTGGGSINTSKTTLTAAKNACGVYRPVLELIPEGEEPYNNLPDMPACYDENFQYDKYTDTGYFGRIKAVDFIDGDTLANNVGLTAGTSYLPGYDWLKFYYHGAIVFIPMSPLRYGISWVDLNNAKLLYGSNIGDMGRTDISILNHTYTVEALTVTRGTPRWNDDSWQDWNIPTMNSGTYSNAGETDYILNLRGRLNRYSMVQELLVRVCGSKILNRNFMYSTDELSTNASDGNAWCNYPVYSHCYGTYQVGDNWAEFSLSDMCVRHCDGFTGNAIIDKYVYPYSYNNWSNNSTWESSLGLSLEDCVNKSFCNGIGFIFPFSYPTDNLNENSWRPALYLQS